MQYNYLHDLRAIMNKVRVLAAGKDCETFKDKFIEMVADYVKDPTIKSWMQ